MSKSHQKKYDVIIVGAGPYGLSAASFLNTMKISCLVIGHPLDLWRNHMVQSAQLRSPLVYSCPANPHYRQLLFDWYQSVTSKKPKLDVRLTCKQFINFMRYFLKIYDVNPLQDLVFSLEQYGDFYLTTLHDGKKYLAKNIIIATGVYGMENTIFSETINSKHSFNLLNVKNIKEKRILIVGAGQSAAESAEYVKNLGAREITIFTRNDNGIFYNSVHSISKIHNLKKMMFLTDVFPTMDQKDRLEKYDKMITPSIEPDYRTYLSQNACLVSGRELKISKRGNFFCLSGDKYKEEFDYMLQATGYKLDIRKLPFLIEKSLFEKITCIENIPILDINSQSTSKGLYFSGILSSLRYGPQSNFIFGSEFITPKIISSICRNLKVF